MKWPSNFKTHSRHAQKYEWKNKQHFSWCPFEWTSEYGAAPPPSPSPHQRSLYLPLLFAHFLSCYSLFKIMRMRICLFQAETLSAQKKAIQSGEYLFWLWPTIIRLRMRSWTAPIMEQKKMFPDDGMFHSSCNTFHCSPRWWPERWPLASSISVSHHPSWQLSTQKPASIESQRSFCRTIRTFLILILF